MKKHKPTKAPAPPGRRSGTGASSVVPYLEEARSSKPVPLTPDEDPPPPVPRKRSLLSRWRGGS